MNKTEYISRNEEFHLSNSLENISETRFKLCQVRLNQTLENSNFEFFEFPKFFDVAFDLMWV